ncbi:MAG TPA: diaminopimelate decarboxylase [Limnochordia bacterium]|nr:diaminopimelate decarboxylase [Limnochordia bacterium]
MLRGSMAIEDGRLKIGGCDVVQLAKEFGTPLYVVDEAMFRSRCREYRAGLSAVYPKSRVIYAGKALLNAAICRIVEQEGLALDVVSGGELYTALHAGFPADRIYFHGNNKSIEELEMALDAGVHRIIVDNFDELELLEALAKSRSVVPDILLRVTPGVEVHTHSYIRTGHLDSKFGFSLHGGMALKAIERAVASPHLRLRGVHCHIGSQIFDITAYDAACEIIFEFLARAREATGFAPEELNLGGGLGVRYVEVDHPTSPAEFVAHLAQIVMREARRWRFELPALLIEPGRSIAAEAGTTLYTVGSVKEIPGVRTYVAVDGGMNDNPRVALYQARYEAIVANKADAPKTNRVTVAGKLCESGDILIWDLEAPKIQPGDILAVFATGAYNYSMASNYNRLPKPAMVLVADGSAELIVARETFADLVRFDRIPARLRDARDQAAAAHDGEPLKRASSR